MRGDREVPRREARHASGWAVPERVRRERLRRDAARPLAVNLAEGLALSDFLSTFTGAARRR